MRALHLATIRSMDMDVNDRYEWTVFRVFPCISAYRVLFMGRREVRRSRHEDDGLRYYRPGYIHVGLRNSGRSMPLGVSMPCADCSRLVQSSKDLPFDQ